MSKDRQSHRTWIAPYEDVIAIHDPDNQLVEIIERSGCMGGAAWSHHHISRSTPQLVSSRMLWDSVRYILRVGESQLELKASSQAAGIQSVQVENDQVSITYAGLGGGGVGTAACRKLARDVVSSTSSEHGGSRSSTGTITVPKRKRVLIGVDDTDTTEEGATWALVHNIAAELDEHNARYLSHGIVQLYPVKSRTQNCVATVVEFACINEQKLIDQFETLLSERTLSGETGMAAFIGFNPSGLKEFGITCKQKEVNISEALKVAENSQTQTILKRRGVIGAVAAIPFFAQPVEAVAP